MSERGPLEKRCRKEQGLVEISCQQGLFKDASHRFYSLLPQKHKTQFC